MKEEELLIKEMRVNAWERTHIVPDLPELQSEVNESMSFVIGDFFNFRKDNNGNFMIMENQTLSI